MDFQAKVQKGKCVKIPETKPDWKPMSRGIAINADDLKDFLQNELGDLLLNTIVKADGKKWVQLVVEYITHQKEESISAFLNEFKQSSKKDITQSFKNLVPHDFCSENPDVDMTKITKEMAIICALLHLEMFEY